jgi:hypothetical protein
MSDRDAAADFDAFYAREIAPWIEEQEVERKALVRRVALLGGPVLVLGVVVAIAGFLDYPSENMAAVVAFVGFAIGAGGLALGYPLFKWGNAFKAELSARVFTHFGYAYAPQPPDDFFEPFRGAGILPGYDRRSLEDHVTGEVGGVRFELAEAHLEVEHKRKNHTVHVTVFRGLIARYDFPKRFSGRATVRADMGAIGNRLGHGGVEGERVRLESTDFEKAFEVFSTDQVEARYLLTPAFMERMLTLKVHAPGGLQAAFMDDHLWLSIDAQRDLFCRPSLFRDLRRSGHVGELIADIQLIGEIARVLKLDAATRV